MLSTLSVKGDRAVRASCSSLSRRTVRASSSPWRRSKATASSWEPSAHSFACCAFSGSYGCDDGTFQNVNSRHPGGANVLFADGSVHFIKSSIAIKTWWALGTKANGEVISSDTY